MGVITLTELRAETKFNLKNRADAALTSTRLNRWINAAYRHMCLPTVHKFDEMKQSYDITLVAGTNTYSLSKATLGDKVVGLRSAHHILSTAITPTDQKRKLSPRNIRWFDRRTLVSGAPTVYCVEAETLYIHPVPDANANNQFIRVRFYKEPTALSADSDTTVIADYYDEVLVIGSQWMAERALGYKDKAEMTKQDYIGLLNEGPEQEQLEAEDWDFQVDVNPYAQQGMV